MPRWKLLIPSGHQRHRPNKFADGEGRSGTYWADTMRMTRQRGYTGYSTQEEERWRREFCRRQLAEISFSRRGAWAATVARLLLPIAYSVHRKEWRGGPGCAGRRNRLDKRTAATTREARPPSCVYRLIEPRPHLPSLEVP